MQSGPRLIQLLQHDIRPILRKEDGNHDAMYLYSLGAWWVPVLAACVAADQLPGCNPRRQHLMLQAPSLNAEKYRRWRRQQLAWFLEDLKRAET